ncbi:MAG: cyanophycin synthetase [Flavobacteriales bacterium]
MEKKHTSAPLRIVGGQLLDARRAALSAHGPHRLEPVATVNDVLYINDSKATFLDAALESLASIENRVVWIVGTWSDDMADGHVQELLKQRVSALVLYTPPLDAVSASLPEHVYQAEELRTAVFVAHELAKPGEVVLFSPACPSGNGFANYEERGAEFKRAVKDL